jgi:HK97 gp10 family phage protein
MATTSFEVTGLRELGQAMTELSADIAKKVAFAGVLAGAGVVKKSAQQKAHVADAAYLVQQKAGDKAFLVQPANIARKLATKRVKSGLTAEYAVFVKGKRKDGFAGRAARLMEFGTVKQAAKPFLRPAFEATKEQAANAIKERLAKRIAKANTTKK